MVNDAVDKLCKIKNRSQVYNEKTGMYIKRNTSTGRFISSSRHKYNGIVLENK